MVQNGKSRNKLKHKIYTPINQQYAILKTKTETNHFKITSSRIIYSSILY